MQNLFTLSTSSADSDDRKHGVVCQLRTTPADAVHPLQAGQAAELIGLVFPPSDQAAPNLHTPSHFLRTQITSALAGNRFSSQQQSAFLGHLSLTHSLTCVRTTFLQKIPTSESIRQAPNLLQSSKAACPPSLCRDRDMCVRDHPREPARTPQPAENV